MFKNFKMKKGTSLIVTFLMMFTMVTPSTVFASTVDKDTVVLQILATSDLHGVFYPYDYATNAEDKSGSLANIATAIKQLKTENPDTILVDAGDTIEGNSQGLFLDGINPMMVAMNEIGYDTWTLGNHEFNKGIPTLEKNMNQFKGNILAGNVHRKDGTTLGKPYAIVEKAGVKVGIIGMTNPNITKWDGPRLTEYTVTSPIEETRKVINEIKDEVDVMIAVQHIGDTQEYVEYDSAENLAKACPELTAIVAAHAHKAVEGTKVNGVVIVENKSTGDTLAKIDIKVTKKDGQYAVGNKESDVTSKLVYMQDPKTKEVNYEADKELLTKLQPYHETALKDTNTVIGELKGGDLVGPEKVKGIPNAQVEDTAMIDLINAVQMHYTGADVSSAAAFRDDANMREGQIKKADSALIYKYDNTLYLVEVTGKQLKQYMEWSAKFYNTYKPGDLTVSFNENIRGYNYDMFSGVKYEIDISKEVGSRIVNLRRMDDTPIKDTDVLKLAVNNYRYDSQLSKAGAIYAEGEELPKLLQKDVENTPIRELIKDYIENVKKGVIAPEVDNNWKVVGTDWDEAQREEAIKLINEGKIELPRSEDGRTANVAAVTKNDLIKANGGKVIDVVSFNDFHGSVEASGKNQGIAKVAGAINAMKKRNSSTIVVSGGDLYQGSAMSNLTYGDVVSEFLKSIGITASAVGNHEFDWGVDKIAKWSEKGKFNFLASNIYDKNTGKPVSWAKPYVIVEKDGVKIGLVGLATPETLYKTKAENVKNLEFRDPIKAAEEWAKVARDNGADVVIALTHLGAFQDSKTKEITGEAAELAKSGSVDAVISAHTHATVCGKVEGIPVVQGYYNGRTLAKLQVVLDNNNSLLSIEPSLDELYKRGDTILEDEEAKAILEKYKEKVGPILGEVVGTTDKDLTHDKSQGPSLLGEWICDVMRKASGAQVAITNGGGIRTSIAKGNITMGNLYEVMPFDNTLVTMELKGSDLKANIEHGINNEKVGWVQISGVMVTYKDGKINSMTLLDGTPVDMNKYYKVVTNDFMATNGDEYNFSNAKDVVDTAVPIRDAMVDAIKAAKNLSVNKVGYLTEGEAKPIEKPEVKPQPEVSNAYVVKSGDTLRKIGERYGVDYREIIKANGIKNPSMIFPGQKIVIPGKIIISKDTVYIVVKGDTLRKISDKFSIDYNKIAKKNNIKNVNMIYIGQHLVIPAN
ncbi:LysM peptidoglycan-binding domain-containing protein [Clostridium bovifaecis]|uniref:LysM peptidoglycan-binding domain-containing protein n=1 Tax=Clostridium bovifaecis TaxID=2184719 RepID=A0A6I6F1J1_9CLOT|nr:LysM peptidoglycan-binding domain-containing protein [Clostridium bovifaecis]